MTEAVRGTTLTGDPCVFTYIEPADRWPDPDFPYRCTDCPSSTFGWRCTMPVGHAGPHQAHITPGYVCATWQEDPYGLVRLELDLDAYEEDEEMA